MIQCRERFLERFLERLVERLVERFVERFLEPERFFLDTFLLLARLCFAAFLMDLMRDLETSLALLLAFRFLKLLWLKDTLK